MTTQQVLLTILVMAVMTFLTRVIPFILFPASKETPAIIKYLSQVLPFAIIGMLVVYCLKSISIFTAPRGTPEFIAVLFVVLIHKWRHNLLLSIGGGTVLYMILIQFVFV